MWHILAQVVTLQPSPWIWAVNHLHLIGWPTLCILAWRISKAFTQASSQITKTVGQIDTMATNHFPHMQSSLERQDIFLANIDRNIGRLADKS
jgi:hypothetical protein